MRPLALRALHEKLGARFLEVNGGEAPGDYGDARRERTALTESAAVLDLSYRGRLCVTGDDRLRFLNGQITNDVLHLAPGQGCRAALVNAKAKMVSDLRVHVMDEAILLDFEPGLYDAVAERLEKHIIADAVELVDVRELYGLLSVQGPKSGDVWSALRLELDPPKASLSFTRLEHSPWGDVYVMKTDRVGAGGLDFFVPQESLNAAAEAIGAAVPGGWAGWTALETARIEAGYPRFGADMDETNLAPEIGLGDEFISYSKGCYIGQEIIARIRTYGQVAKSLRGLRLPDDLKDLPQKGHPLFQDGKQVGQITSAVWSPAVNAPIALGYIRREANVTGARLRLRPEDDESSATVVELPFRASPGRG